PGVEIHAQVLESALTREALSTPAFAISLEFLAALILGLLVIAFAPGFGPITLVLVGRLLETKAREGTGKAVQSLIKLR
ncbi:hypothetical protein QR510_31200, partial [Escherichia coli]|uniref:hypothetical protein n=1 Tax=Escherichia coli TaxID=562 RepID=UPI00273A50A6